MNSRDESGDGSLLDERRAEAIVHSLVDKETATCSDCGETVDLSEANDPMMVVVTLEKHRQTHGGDV